VGKLANKKSIIILFLFLFFSGCGGGGSSEQGIVGHWIWIESIGGLAGESITPESTGEIRRVVFDSDGKVNFYTDGTSTLSSPYTLSSEITIFGPEPLPVLHVEGVSFVYAYSFASAIKLELKENITDGYIHRYVREP